MMVNFKLDALLRVSHVCWLCCEFGQLLDPYPSAVLLSLKSSSIFLGTLVFTYRTVSVGSAGLLTLLFLSL